MTTHPPSHRTDPRPWPRSPQGPSCKEESTQNSATFSYFSLFSGPTENSTSGSTVISNVHSTQRDIKAKTTSCKVTMVTWDCWIVKSDVLEKNVPLLLKELIPATHTHTNKLENKIFFTFGLKVLVQLPCRSTLLKFELYSALNEYESFRQPHLVRTLGPSDFIIWQ